MLLAPHAFSHTHTSHHLGQLTLTLSTISGSSHSLTHTPPTSLAAHTHPTQSLLEARTRAHFPHARTSLVSHARQHTPVAPASRVPLAPRARTPRPPGLSASRTRPRPAASASAHPPRGPLGNVVGTGDAPQRRPDSGSAVAVRAARPTCPAPGLRLLTRRNSPPVSARKPPLSAEAPQWQTPGLRARRRRNSRGWRSEGAEPEQRGEGRGLAEGRVLLLGEEAERRAYTPPSSASVLGGRGPGVRAVAELGGRVRRRAARAFPLPWLGDRKRP